MNATRIMNNGNTYYIVDTLTKNFFKQSFQRSLFIFIYGNDKYAIFSQ